MILRFNKAPHFRTNADDNNISYTQYYFQCKKKKKYKYKLQNNKQNRIFQSQ